MKNKTTFNLNKKFSYFAPGIENEDFSGWVQSKINSLEWNTPILQTMHLKKIIEQLHINRKTYLTRMTDEILISVLGQVAIRWLDPEYPLRRLAMKVMLLTTGCSSEVISEGLNLAFREVQPHHLESVLHNLAEFPKSKLLALIFAGIIPTPMLFDLFLGLLIRTSVLLKSPSREPFFSILLVHSIHEIDPELANCIAAFWWPGGRWNLEKVLFKKADLIHAYGDDKTIYKIKVQVPPNKKLLNFGHKTSFAFIGKEALESHDKVLAERLAYDVALYDQQGCMSPHIVYVQTGGSLTPDKWAKSLAEAFPLITEKFPSGMITLGEASQIQQIRGQYSSYENNLCISSYPTTAWTVVYENRPDFHPSCLNRVIFVKPVTDLNDLSKILKNFRGSFESLGYAGNSQTIEKLKEIASFLNISHLHAIGSMQALTFKEHVEERAKLIKKIKKS